MYKHGIDVEKENRTANSLRMQHLAGFVRKDSQYTRKAMAKANEKLSYFRIYLAPDNMRTYPLFVLTAWHFFSFASIDCCANVNGHKAYNLNLMALSAVGASWKREYFCVTTMHIAISKIVGKSNWKQETL